jgi:amino acid transporter
MYIYGLWGIIAAYIMAFLLVLPMAVTIALAVSAMPRAGGLFPMMSRIFSPSLTFFISWIYLYGYGFIVGVISCVAIVMFGSTSLFYGTMASNQAMVNIGTTFLSANGIAIGALVFILAQWAITLFSMKVIKWLERFLFVIPLIVLGLMLGFLFAAGGNYPSAFNAVWGKGVAEAVIARASQLGFVQPTFSWDKASMALFVGLYAFGGFEIVTLVSGEVKSPRRSLSYGLVGGLTLVVILFVISAASVGSIENFANSYGFLYYEHPDALKQIMTPAEPSIPLFAASAMPFWLAILIPPFALLWIIKSVLPAFVGNSRLIFGLAMDRSLPQQFAKVNRFGSPSWATHLQAVLAILGVVAFTQSIGTILALLTWAGMVHFWIFGFAMLVFPYVRKDIFEKSPIQWRFGGIPVISILGLLTTIIGFFIFTYSLTQLNLGAVIAICLLLGIGLLIHIYQVRKNEKQGVSMADIYAQMPPE